MIIFSIFNYGKDKSTTKHNPQTIIHIPTSNRSNLQGHCYSTILIGLPNLSAENFFISDLLKQPFTKLKSTRKETSS